MDTLRLLGGAILFIGIFLVFSSQLGLGWMGLDYLLGWWAPWVALVLAVLFRLTLPFTVGAYFGAVYVMGWPWYVGLACALPGLVFMVPAVISIAIEKVRGGR